MATHNIYINIWLHIINSRPALMLSHVATYEFVHFLHIITHLRNEYNARIIINTHHAKWPRILPRKSFRKVMQILPRESFRKPTRIFPENLAAVFIAANTVLGPQIFDRNSSRFSGRVVTRKIRGGFRIMFGASMLHDVLILVLQFVEAIQK